jgi:hypothetical protein
MKKCALLYGGQFLRECKSIALEGRFTASALHTLKASTAIYASTEHRSL